jgi:hypothetical protein
MSSYDGGSQTAMPKIVAGPKGIPGKVVMMTDTIPSQDRIRKRAYELSALSVARISLLMAALGCSPPALCQSFSGVLTWHNDNARTGQNLQETILTPALVNSKSFGKVFSYSFQGQAYGQPLYVPNVSIPGQGTHNVVYVATEHDQLYAFDADGTESEPFWHVSFINPAKGITTVSTKHSPCASLKPEVGITATPVIDPASGTLYVSVETDEKGTIIQRLHALDISSGAEKFNGPVLIQGSFKGATFDPSEIQRTGLLLESGNVYLAWASLCDLHPYHGWVLAYNAQNLQQQTAIFSTTPNGHKGGIWQTGGGLASDGESIYFMTGDGTFDAHTGGANYGMSMLRMSIKGGALTVADYFTPFDWARRSAKDLDLGSGGVLLLPTQNRPHPEEIIGADKSGDIFLVDRQHMGKFHDKTNDVVQQLHGAGKRYMSSPAYWQQNIYYAGVNDHLSMYSISDGLLSTSPISKSTTIFGPPGATPSISADGAHNAIVWVVEVYLNAPGVLRAYDATNLTKELYSSDQAAKGRDKLGQATRFSVPTVANGTVYIATQTELDAYGLLQ